MGFNIGGMLKSVINPMTLAQLAMGPAGWASIAMKAVMSQVVQQVIQNIGEKLGLPQGIIDTAKTFAAQRMGDTGGFGNSVVATTETAGAGLMSFLALAAPVIAFVVAVLLLIAVFVFGRKLLRKFRNFNADKNTKTISVEAIDRKHLE